MGAHQGLTSTLASLGSYTAFTRANSRAVSGALGAGQ